MPSTDAVCSFPKVLQKATKRWWMTPRFYYQMTTRYHPEAARGVRWDDPMLAIDCPLPTVAVVSDADRAQPIFAAATGG